MLLAGTTKNGDMGMRGDAGELAGVGENALTHVIIEALILADRLCVLRQAQDEEDRKWHLNRATKKGLILSLSKDASK